MLIMYAALQAIPSELYDAAKVDGASTWQTAWYIRIPMIFPAIVLTMIFSLIGTLQLFNEPRVLQTIAPTVISGNFTPNIYVYNLAFSNRQFDYSAAIAFTLALVTGVLAGLLLLGTRRTGRHKNDSSHTAHRQRQQRSEPHQSAGVHFLVRLSDLFSHPAGLVGDRDHQNQQRVVFYLRVLVCA